MSYLSGLHSAIFNKVALVLVWLTCAGLVSFLGVIIINWISGMGGNRRQQGKSNGR